MHGSRLAILLVGSLSFVFSSPHAARGNDDEPPDMVLERLRAEELERDEARAEAEAREAAEEQRRERERQEKDQRAAKAAREAAAVFERRRAAMRDWHRRTFQNLAPVLAAREEIYRRLPYRRFAAVRPACVAYRAAIADATPGFLKAPDRRVDLLMTDLFAIYRESARCCAEGAYFSFTAQEAEVRRVVGELIDALEPYGLAFPVRWASGPTGRRTGGVDDE
jgi:hypothetical protein